MTPIVTIVIPVYNRAHLVTRTLDSIKAQTYRPLKLILVDNNSTDNTHAVLWQWQLQNQADDFEVEILMEKTPGAAAARNAGLNRVATEWTMFFDSDDVMAPTHLERFVRLTKERHYADIIGWDVYLHHGKKVSIKEFADKNLIYNCLLSGSMATQRYAARTKLFKKAGGWDSRLEIWDDIELGVRMLAICKNVYYDRKFNNGEPTVDVYFQSESLTGELFSKKSDKIAYTLSVIRENLPRDKAHIVNLKSIILAADYYIEGRPDLALPLRSNVLKAEKNTFRRMALKIAYAYRSHGLRGIHRLLKFIMS